MEELSSAETADLVRRYEAAAFDEIARHGGTVVKMLGDGAVFTTTTVEAAARIALSLLGKAGRGGIPPARAGICFGPVIRSQGDVYGPTVNRASRLCDLAPTDGVLVDQSAAELLPDGTCTLVGPFNLKGIGPTIAYRLDALE
jgi:adenylate cyclase